MSIKTVINVKGFAYCELEIEATNVPTSLNMVNSIDIFDGFGIALPTLRLRLFDNDHTLTSRLSLNDATKITILLSKEDTQPIVRKFRVFGYKRENGNEGPTVSVVAILDAPKWSAGVYREAFSKSPSMDAIASMANSAGLKYDGPTSSTNDRMTWLNINQTRSSFSEDIAMRGYASGGSCMARVVTMNGVVRYKDIIKQLLGTPRASLLLNAIKEEAEYKPIRCYESNNTATSGIISHWFNYGYEQHEHNLSGEQGASISLDAPVLGSSLPINSEVRGMLKGARVTYVGFDPGTEPAPASNVHEFYERAYYQNLRYLGLFTERIRLMSDDYTDIETFDCVEYLQSDSINHTVVPNKSLSGKYLLGGKGIHIKNGHWYYETFDLYRPYIQEAGASSMVTPAPSYAGATQAKANDGSISLPATPNIDTTAPSAASRNATSAAAKPAIKSAVELMQALNAYDEANPAIPTKPLPKAGTAVDPAISEIQAKMRQAQQALKSGPLSSGVDHETPRTLEAHATIKKIDAASVKIAMLIAVGEHTGPAPEMQTLAIERFSETGSDQMNVPIENVVATASISSMFDAGSVVGDVNSGGFHEADLTANGLSIPEGTNDLAIVTAEAKTAEAGVQMISKPDDKDRKSSGYGFDFKPKEAAEFFADLSLTDPDEFLATRGAEDYIKVFGAVSNAEAKKDLDILYKESTDAAGRYGEAEILVDSAQRGSTGDKAATGANLVLKYGDPSLTPTGNLVKEIAPYIGKDSDSPSFKAASSILKTTRAVVSWPDLFGYGADRAEQESSSESWSWPFSFPEHTPKLSHAGMSKLSNATVGSDINSKEILKESALEWGNKEVPGSVTEGKKYAGSSPDVKDATETKDWFKNLFSEEKEKNRNNA